MKRNKRAAYCLLVISLLLLIIPVFPHHHHANGLICMKNDVQTEDCQIPAHPHSQPPHKHCCCHTGCITILNYQQSNNNDVQRIIDEDLWRTDVLPQLLSDCLIIPEIYLEKTHCFFRETLHDIRITNITGWRAPPTL